MLHMHDCQYWISCLGLLCHSPLREEKKKATNSCLVEIKSPGRFVQWVDLCKQPGFTSLGTFPHTTIEMTYISICSLVSEESAVSVGGFGNLQQI